MRSATIALGSALVLAGSTASLAQADPPALNEDPCATVLFQAANWPSRSSDEIRLVSDGFVTPLPPQAPGLDGPPTL
jgi:hypothetical protein